MAPRRSLTFRSLLFAEPSMPVARAPRYAVVLAGGSGTRFWPRSRARVPKQLLPIVSTRPLLQETVARLAPLFPAERVCIVTARDQARAVRRHVRGAPRLLLEPEGRNTAAAIALAALDLARSAPDGVMAVLPADHAITDPATFRADLRLALDLAATSGALVTLGIRPTRAEVGYGWIRPGADVPGTRRRAAWVRTFVEKPPAARAAAFFAGGRMLWNAGIFAWRIDAILAALRTHCPAVIGPLEAAFGKGRRALAAAYARVPSVPIDSGVMEHARRVTVVRARFGWSDVGSWAAVAELLGGNGDGTNAVRGHALPIDSRGCLVDSPDRLVALVGVDDLVVVDTKDAVLVCRKDRAQDVRKVTDELRRRGLRRYL
jgi:mannose-1-phosphate guanylyltransferase